VTVVFSKNKASCLRPSTTQREGNPFGGTKKCQKLLVFSWKNIGLEKDQDLRLHQWKDAWKMHIFRECIYISYHFFGEQMKHMSIPV